MKETDLKLNPNVVNAIFTAKFNNVYTTNTLFKLPYLKVEYPEISKEPVLSWDRDEPTDDIPEIKLVLKNNNVILANEKVTTDFYNIIEQETVETILNNSINYDINTEHELLISFAKISNTQFSKTRRFGINTILINSNCKNKLSDVFLNRVGNITIITSEFIPDNTLILLNKSKNSISESFVNLIYNEYNNIINYTFYLLEDYKDTIHKLTLNF